MKVIVRCPHCQQQHAIGVEIGVIYTPFDTPVDLKGNPEATFEVSPTELKPGERANPDAISVGRLIDFGMNPNCVTYLAENGIVTMEQLFQYLDKNPAISNLNKIGPARATSILQAVKLYRR